MAPPLAASSFNLLPSHCCDLKSCTFETGSKPCRSQPPEQLVILHIKNDTIIRLLASDHMMETTLNRFVQELKSKNEDVRIKAAHDIYVHVVAATRGK